MKLKKENFFRLFLLVYLAFFIWHSIDLNWGSPIVPLTVIAGLGFAILAHTRSGYLTIVLLLVHMSLEWIEHGRHGWHYSNRDIAIHSIHVCMDFAFLYTELRVHVNKFCHRIFFSSVGFLGLLFIAFHQEPVGNSHEGNIIGSFVIGGMLGCLISHLKPRRL